MHFHGTEVISDRYKLNTYEEVINYNEKEERKVKEGIWKELDWLKKMETWQLVKKLYEYLKLKEVMRIKHGENEE